MQHWQYKINDCSALITRLHHWSKKDANFCIELWSPTKAHGKKRTLFIKDCIDRRNAPAVNPGPLKNEFAEDTIPALMPFVEEYLPSSTDKVKSIEETPQKINQNLSSESHIQPTPICDEKPEEQQGNNPKESDDKIAQSLVPNTNPPSSIPVYKTKVQGSSCNHKSTPTVVPPICCSGIFYEEENIIILEEENANSLIVVCSEAAVNTESDKQKLIQTIAAKNNKFIKYIITATTMGRCTSWLFEEGVQHRAANSIDSRHLVTMSDLSQDGNNFCFAVNNFKVIESPKPSYTKRMQPILTNVLSFAGIGLSVYVCILLFYSIKSKLYS